jgi:hypothetical protein
MLLLLLMLLSYTLLCQRLLGCLQLVPRLPRITPLCCHGRDIYYRWPDAGNYRTYNHTVMHTVLYQHMRADGAVAIARQLSVCAAASAQMRVRTRCDGLSELLRHVLRLGFRLEIHGISLRL